MPPNIVLKSMNRIHRLLLGATNGKVGWTAMGMPVLELTTTGRRSGQPRKTMLTSPYQEGSTYVIVASRGGDDFHPAWYLNLLENPDVKVSIRGSEPQSMRAETMSAEDRERIWPQIASRYRNYAGYQAKTNREIPLVFLKPSNG